MKPVPTVLAALVGLALAACGGTGAPTGTVGGTTPQPGPATEALVRFSTPLPCDARLALYDAEVKNVFEVRVGTGTEAGCTVASARVNVQSIRSALSAAKRVKAGDYVPAGASDVASSNPNALVAPVTLNVYRDLNGDGLPQDNEWLDFMTHDLLVYAEEGFALNYRTDNPPMRHTWRVAPGFARVRHHVYRVSGEQTYRRSMTTVPDFAFDLHVETPAWSM